MLKQCKTKGNLAADQEINSKGKQTTSDGRFLDSIKGQQMVNYLVLYLDLHSVEGHNSIFCFMHQNVFSCLCIFLKVFLEKPRSYQKEHFCSTVVQLSLV